MIVFVDASALVAITKGEPERADLLDRFTLFERGLWSAMSCWEAVSALSRSYRMNFADAVTEVRNTAGIMRLKLVEIDRDELDAALDAYDRYGKGSGHPAKLNMGDCFAYACAKTNSAHLLYKGDDFSHTDLGR
ncbi:ribonuclease VapC [Sphingomonas metalli]|uniref:Ribonuclease VapC n=1 Tax=Sphingomonas metalli TaxID=1779358 RepID=A0A916SXS1_9SPHN|nr:type II toxin-antitoxin system VapC family toxin [Sphingomonas metalli]GGB18707.1 ribonuclease VapC [Sphingomonas metalli]